MIRRLASRKVGSLVAGVQNEDEVDENCQREDNHGRRLLSETQKEGCDS